MTNRLRRTSNLNTSAQTHHRAATTRARRHWSWILTIAIVLLLGGSQHAFAAPYYLWSGQSNSNTQLDTTHSSSWYIQVLSSSVAFGGGDFKINAGPHTVDPATLTLFQNGPGGTVLASVTVPASSFGTSGYSYVSFHFSTVQALPVGRYYVSLTSVAPTTASTSYSIKGITDAFISLDGTLANQISSTIATVSQSPIGGNLTLSKTAPPTALTSGSMTYTISLGNDGGTTSGTSATVSDQLPVGVKATAVSPGTGVSSVSCTNLNTASAQLTCTVGLASGLGPSTGTGAAAFTIAATAPASAGSITNYASVDPAGGAAPATPGSSCATTSCGSATTTVTAGPNFTLSKTATASVASNGTITYTLGLGNSGGAASGTSATIADQLPTGVKATAVTPGAGVSSVSCTNLNTASARSVCTVTLSSGLAAAASAGTASFTMTATAPSTAGSITNYASVDAAGGATPATPGSSCATTACASAATTVTAPTNFTLSKTGPATVQTGGPMTYTINVGNSGGSTSGTSATVSDQLPAGVKATAVAAGTGVSSVSCTNLNSASALLSCTVSLSSGLSAGAATGAARFTITATAPSSAGAITNYASVDAAGGSAPPTPGSSCATSSCGSAATTVLTPADLTVASTHTGSFAQGGSGSYTVLVTNSGGAASSGTVTLVDTLPAGLTPTAVSGTGWSCGVSGQTATCTRADAAAGSSSYPAVSVTVSVASTASSPVVNSVTVSGGGETDTTNDTATDSTVVTTPPDLTLSVSHTGTFSQGQTGATYTLTATNAGGGTTSGTVTITDTLPAGLTPTAASGTGWSCSISGQVATCSRSDALPASSSFPAVTVTVTVASNATGTLANGATISGGGESNTANDSASDATTIAPAADLALTASRSGSFLPGQSGTFSLVVSNAGGSPSSGMVTVTQALGVGLSATSASGTGWSCAVSGQTVTCTRSDALAASGSFPAISILASVGTNVTTALSSTATVANAGDLDSSNDNATVALPAPPDLTIAVSHTGTFSQGQTGAVYSVIVTNGGSNATGGTVTVTDTLPIGMTPTAAAGSGWTCGIAGRIVTCTRTDALAPSTAYPALAVTVSVTSNAMTPLANVATVSGGGEGDTTNDSSSDSTTITAVAPDVTVTLTHTGTLSQGQSGAAYSAVITNSGGANTSGTITFTTTFAAGLSITSATGAGWSCSVSGQVVTCTRNDVLAAGTGFPPIAIAASVSNTAGTPLTNTAGVSGGGETNTANDAASDVTVIVQHAADVTVSIGHGGTLTQGDQAVPFTATVSNSGGQATSGTITLIAALPTGVTPTTANGAGWSCTIAGSTGTCVRADQLGAGAAYPAVSLTASVSADAPAASTATATVSGGGETNTLNDVASDALVIVSRGSRLVAALSRAGDLLAGGKSAYSIAVSNAGPGSSTGLVTVTNIVPPGLTPQSASGPGWSCTIAGQVVTCTRADTLAPGAAFPVITIGTAVAITATGTVVDTVSVTGATSSTTASDTATVVAANVAVLQSTMTVTNSGFNIGLSSGYTVVIQNKGSGPSSGPVTVALNMSSGATVASAGGPGWTCTVQTSGVTCSRSDALAAGASYPALTIIVTVTATEPQTVNISTLVSGGGMPQAKSSTTTVPISYPEADLSAHIAHSGALSRTQTNAAFAVDVQNAGPNATTGVVRLAIAVPAGLHATSATGAGWACAIQDTAVECTRSDNLSAKGTYPIDLRVSVDANAPDGLTVSGTVTSDHDPAPGNNVVSDAVRVITFTSADFKVDKSVDRSTLKIGDAAQFRLKVKNLSEATLNDVKLTDSLPKGFTYVNGTARVLLPAGATLSGAGSSLSPAATSLSAASAGRSTISAQSAKASVLGSTTAPAIPTTIDGQVLTPAASNGALSFSLGSMTALEEATVTYYAIVGIDAKPGTQRTQVVGTFQSPLGERVSAAPVTVAVTVMASAFASEQVIVGRVFDDANRNGLFDKGDKGLSGVRVILPTGQSAITDRNGLYNLPAVAAGTTTITVDPATVPQGYTVPQSNVPSESGWTRLLRTPLGGGALLRQNFALVRASAPAVEETQSRLEPTISEPVREATGETNWPPDAMTRRKPSIGRLEIEAERGELDAGGRDRAFVTIRAFDLSGAPLKSGSVIVETTAGQWLLPEQPRGDEAARAAAQLEPAAQPAMPTGKSAGSVDYCRRDAAAVELPVGLQTGTAVIHDGVARVCLQSDIAPLTAQLHAAADDGSGVEAKTNVRFVVARTAPVLAAVGEIGIGRGEPATADAPASGNVHGTGAMFFQGVVSRDAQFTAAWTTADSINQAAGVDRRFGLDPTDRVYPVFGDDSTRQELAASNSRAYARLDVKRSSITFGDLHGDVARVDRSGLLDISRSLTGTEVHLERRADQWLTVQAARPDTAFAREIFPGTAAGFLHLAHAPVLIGSDVLTLEIRDRRRPDLVRDREPLVRGVDYVLDPLAGIVYFNRPLPLFDDALNVVQVVSTYEYQTSGLHNSVFVARGQQDVASIGLALRATALQQGVSGGSNIFVGGVEADQQLPNHGRLHIELPLSRGIDATGNASSDIGSAIRAEVDQPIGLHRAVVRARLSRSDSVFNNPYGSPVVPGSTVASASIDAQATATGRIRVTTTGESTHSAAADATRTAVGVEWTQKVGPQVDLTGMFDDRHLDDARADRQVDSQLVTGQVDWRPSDQVQTSVRREQNLGTADPTYPDQTVANARYRMTAGTQLFATQRWSDAPIIPITGVGAGGLFTPLSTRETAVGVESRLQRFTTLTTRYQIDGGLNGTDGFAVLGVLTRIPIAGPWSIDGGLDHAVHVQGSGDGYTSATGGISFAPDAWRASLSYQFRSGTERQHLLSTGVAGQLAPSVTALAHYRTADYLVSGVSQTRVDALAAIAVRPRGTDRAGLLFSWNYGDDLSPVIVVTQEPGHRVGRLSTDAYFQPTARVELYSRLALLRTDLGDLGAASTYLSQSRIQVRLLPRVDVAGELRWVDELSSDAAGRVIGAAEIGFWVSRDLRAALGYTSRPWTASDPTLQTTNGRGGVYFVLTSRLSSLFDLFTPRTVRAESELPTVK